MKKLQQYIGWISETMKSIQKGKTYDAYARLSQLQLDMIQELKKPSEQKPIYYQPIKVPLTGEKGPELVDGFSDLHPRIKIRVDGFLDVDSLCVFERLPDRFVVAKVMRVEGETTEVAWINTEGVKEFMWIESGRLLECTLQHKDYIKN